MEKGLIMRVLEIIYNETKNPAIQLTAGNYWNTLNNMTEEDYNKVRRFYLEFVTEYFQQQLNKIK